MQISFITLRKVKITAGCALVALVSMGNEGCEKAQSRRSLKMDVEVASIAAKPVRLPNGEVVDFPYVVNALFYREVMNSEKFVIANAIPNPSSAVSVAPSGLTSKATEPGQISSAANFYSSSDVAALSEFGLLSTSSSSGSSGLHSKAQSAQTQASEVPACLYELPSLLLGGSVLSFEATWGVGVGIGYGPGGNLPGNVGGKVNFEQSKLELGLDSVHPLIPSTRVIADSVSHQSKVKFGIDFNAGTNIGLDFFFKTPITDVIRAAAKRGLIKIVDAMTKRSERGTWEDTWESRVLYVPRLSDQDTHFGFRGGKEAGVKVGDTFTVTNQIYEWTGAPCTSPLRYAIPETDTPIAEMIVVRVGDNVSVAKVTRYLQDRRVEPGAMVKILALKEPPPTPTPTPNRR